MDLKYKSIFLLGQLEICSEFLCLVCIWNSVVHPDVSMYKTCSLKVPFINLGTPRFSDLPHCNNFYFFYLFQTLDSESSHRSSPVLYDQAVVAAQAATASTTASASTPGQGTRDMNFKATSNNSNQAVIINFTTFFRCYTTLAISD